MADNPSLSRHASLHPLSHDHHHALVLARRLYQIGSEKGADPDDPNALAELAQRLLVAWTEDLEPHFREEEDVLLPLYARHKKPSEDPAVLQMLDDHAWFRDRIHRLREAAEEGAPLASPLKEFGERLRDHVRHEERQVFERIQDALAESELEELARRSAAYRRLR